MQSNNQTSYISLSLFWPSYSSNFASVGFLFMKCLSTKYNYENNNQKKQTYELLRITAITSNHINNTLIWNI